MQLSVVCSVGRSQRWAVTNVALAFEGTQVALFLGIKHIWNIFGTYLGHIWDTPWTYLRGVI